MSVEQATGTNGLPSTRDRLVEYCRTQKLDVTPQQLHDAEALMNLQPGMKVVRFLQLLRQAGHGWSRERATAAAGLCRALRKAEIAESQDEAVDEPSTVQAMSEVAVRAAIELPPVDEEVVKDSMSSTKETTSKKRVATKQQLGKQATSSAGAHEPTEKDALGLYLDAIAKYPLLNAEEEVELSKEIEAGLMAEHMLADDIDEPVSTEASEEELEQLAEQGRQAKQQFLNSNLRLVVSVAKKYNRGKMPLLDLIQEGNTGLIRAVEKFDYTKGFKFSTYSTWWIRQAVTRGIAQQARIIRVPVHVSEQINAVDAARRILTRDLDREPDIDEIADRVGYDVSRVIDLIRYGRDHVSLDQPISDDGDTTLGDLHEQQTIPNPEDTVMDTLKNEALMKLLDTLDERSADVVRRRYGLVTGQQEMLADIGKVWGVTAERVRQIERGAMEKLRITGSKTSA